MRQLAAALAGLLVAGLTHYSAQPLAALWSDPEAAVRWLPYCFGAFERVLLAALLFAEVHRWSEPARGIGELMCWVVVLEGLQIGGCGAWAFGGAGAPRSTTLCVQSFGPWVYLAVGAAALTWWFVGGRRETKR